MLIIFIMLYIAPLGLSSTFLREGNGTQLQYSSLENPIGGGAWWATVHGVARSRTRLRDFTSTFHFHALEKEMATHLSVLAWRIPGTWEPGGLPSMGSHRVGPDCRDLAAAAEGWLRAAWPDPTPRVPDSTGPSCIRECEPPSSLRTKSWF